MGLVDYRNGFTTNTGNLAQFSKFGIEEKLSSTTQAVYIDNISFIPYYKLTYMVLDNETVDAVDYALLDSNNNYLTAYTPDISKSTQAGVIGFSTTPGGESVNSVELKNADIVLYPVTIIPDTFSSASIKTATEFGYGLRYKASVTPAQLESADEFGFIIARHEALSAAGLSDEDLAFNCGVPTASEKSYSKSDDIHVFYGINDENNNTFFTGVLVYKNIPSDKIKDFVTTSFVGRPYVKMNGNYYYGNVIVRKLTDVAKSVRDDGYGDLDAAGIAVIDEIISYDDESGN